MQLQAIDWIVVAVYGLASLLIGIVFTKRAGRSLEQYFLTGRKLPLHGGGRAEKSYIHNRDLARAIHMVAEKAPLGTVYNAGSKEPTSIRRVVELVAEALKMPFEQLCEVTGDRQHQDSRYWLDSSAIKRDVGWEPQISWEEGMREMVDWGRKYLPQLKTLPTDFVMRA